jgi:hypothetical protein
MRASAKCLDSRKEADSQQHLDLANQAYEDHANQTALQEYRIAHQLCRSAMVLFGIAHSEAALGQDSEAARDFERFLREATDAEGELRRDATENLRALSARLTLLELAGAIDGATVLVDGRALGEWRSGTPIYLLPGKHTLLVQGGPGGRFERPLTSLVGGRRLSVEVPGVAPLIPPPEPSATPTPRRRWWLWAGIVGLLIAGAAATAYVVTRPERPPCDFCP